MTPSNDRLEQIADMYATHRDQLQRVVRARGSASDAIAQDACSHAWMQLLTTNTLTSARHAGEPWRG